MANYELDDVAIAEVARLLGKLKPGYLPTPIFDEVARLYVTATIVIVPLYMAPHHASVQLVKRRNGDPVWPSYWHLPGTVLRPTDHEGDFADAFDRLFHGELKNSVPAMSPTLLRTAFTQTARGREISQIFYVVLDKEPVGDGVFDVTNLPSPIIEHEPAYIAEAVKAAQSTQS
jgi:hypothetical protein